MWDERLTTLREPSPLGEEDNLFFFLRKITLKDFSETYHSDGFITLKMH